MASKLYTSNKDIFMWMPCIKGTRPVGPNDDGGDIYKDNLVVDEDDYKDLLVIEEKKEDENEIPQIYDEIVLELIDDNTPISKKDEEKKENTGKRKRTRKVHKKLNILYI